MKFRAIILLSGKSATGIQVPDEIIASLGQSKKPPVRITLGGHTYRTTVASMGGKYMIPLSAENRTSAGVAAGDEVDVDIELDTEPREVTVPHDFSKALDLNANAKKFLDGLSYSNKLRFVLSVDGAKTAETRQRRIESALSMLSEGRTS